MEPIGGAATNALVAPDSYYPRIREICDRYGILLIHDEVMTGVARTGKFLGGDHWNCRPDIVALSKGIGSGYAPLGAMAAPMRIVKPVLDMGGFQHGHTYAGNPLACAAGLAVLGEIDRLGLVENAAAMGEVLMDELRRPDASAFPFIGDVRGKGLLLGARIRRRPRHHGKRCRLRSTIGQRVLDLAYERGLIVYFRRVSGGVAGRLLHGLPAADRHARSDRRDRRDPRRRARRRWRASSTCRSTAEGFGLRVASDVGARCRPHAPPGSDGRQQWSDRALDTDAGGMRKLQPANRLVVVIRPATPDDAETIHALDPELGRIVGEVHKIKSTPADLARHMFGADPALAGPGRRDRWRICRHVPVFPKLFDLAWTPGRLRPGPLGRAALSRRQASARRCCSAARR